MHDQDSPENRAAPVPETVPGEFDRLLWEIETEPVPERLLELALKLQTALVEQRKRRDDQGNPTEI